MELLDFKGKVCPVPVMGTKKYLDENNNCLELGVQVDNMAAVENVRRLLENNGFSVSVTGEGREFQLSGKRRPEAFEKSGNSMSPQIEAPARNTLVMITSDRLGQGDEALGKGLIKNFILTLKEMGPELWRIIFLNAGVKLAAEGSESLDHLIELENEGVSILVCGTCLNHYGLLEKKKIGETTNMLDVVTSLEIAGKVITIS
ncbi:sulfurtransferase-like selenium metabolism protein YedF [Desulforegula conservatrix]|uniref:sulfurtransferase-like selenium metabolism protein YedF n=1 Tax=Desulforegula conservatrix TaxID=153026 RepID=UPI00040E001A|nr:sulfurtransferase-like selenium metabolism protein YedF [Desulforegula conservatrix]